MKPTSTLPEIAASAAGQSREFTAAAPGLPKICRVFWEPAQPAKAGNSPPPLGWNSRGFAAFSRKQVEGSFVSHAVATLGIIAFVAIVVALFVRPSGVLAVGIVGAGIIVSWNDVEQYRQQRAAEAAFRQDNATASAVTVPPSTPAHAGS
jgi:hypothetical protein